METGSAGSPPSDPSAAAPRITLGDAVREFGLMAILMFLTVGVICAVFAGPWEAPHTEPRAGLAVVGAVVGILLLVLIRSPWGRKSGGHMNPAITVALWSMGAFPGRAVVSYLAAQLAGGLLGTALARLVFGSVVEEVNYGAVTAAPDWTASAVFAAEAGGGAAFAVLAGYFLTHATRARWLPLAVGAGVAAAIVGFGPLSGGAVNPARQFGPAVLSGADRFLWIYLIAAPVGAAIAGAALTWLRRRPLLTHRLCGFDHENHATAAPRETGGVNDRHIRRPPTP